MDPGLGPRENVIDLPEGPSLLIFTEDLLIFTEEPFGGHSGLGHSG